MIGSVIRGGKKTPIILNNIINKIEIEIEFTFINLKFIRIK